MSAEIRGANGFASPASPAAKPKVYGEGQAIPFALETDDHENKEERGIRGAARVGRRACGRSVSGERSRSRVARRERSRVSRRSFDPVVSLAVSRDASEPVVSSAPRIISGSTPEPVVSSASRDRWVTAPEGGTPRLPRRRARSGDERPSGGCERWNRSKGGGWRGGCWDRGVVRGARLVQDAARLCASYLSRMKSWASSSPPTNGRVLNDELDTMVEWEFGGASPNRVRRRSPEEVLVALPTSGNSGGPISADRLGGRERSDMPRRESVAPRETGSGERSGVDLGARERLRGPKGVRQSRRQDERLETPRAGITRASSGSQACRDERGSGATQQKKSTFPSIKARKAETCSLRFPPRRPTPRHHPSSRAR